MQRFDRAGTKTHRRWMGIAGVFGLMVAAWPMLVHAQEPDIVGTRRTRIEAPTPMASARFGIVAVAGETVFVGSPNEPIPGSSAGTGRVYRYERDADRNWSHTGELTPDTPHILGGFGSALLGQHDMLFVSAERERTAAGAPLGAVYVFQRDAGGPSAWGFRQRLENPYPHVSAQFGYSFAYDREWLVVGARNLPVTPSSPAGAALVYRRDATGTFHLVQTLTSPDGAAGNFATGVSISDGYIAVADPLAGPHGFIYLFALEGSRFVFRQRIEPTAVPCPDGSGGRCYFSFKVVHYKTTLFASALPNNELYWFERSSDEWNLARRFRPIAESPVTVGNWLAMTPSLLLASGAGASDGVGAAYLFYQHRPVRGSGWGLAATLLPEHTRTNTGFGQPLAIDGSIAAVGASNDSLRAPEAGAAYIFEIQFAHPPRFESAPTYPVTVHAGTPFTYEIVTSDPDGEVLNLTAPTLPSWLALTARPDGTGTLSGTPPASAVGSHPVALRVMDLTGRHAEQSFTVQVMDALEPSPLPSSSRGCSVDAGSRSESSALWAALLLALGFTRRRN